MLKFFRKYNKILLVTLGSVLMVAFLMPNVDIFMPDPTDQPVGTVDGETLRISDRRTADAEMRLLAQMGMTQSLPPDGDGLTWLLLIREARQHGIYASEAQIRGTLEDLQQGQMDPVGVAARAGVGEDLLHQAIRHLIMVNELQMMISSVRRPSEPRLAHFARDIQSSAAADAVVIEPDHLLDEVGEPEPSQIESHFEQYRDDRPGESEPYGFGYFLPPRVQMEYLAVPMDRVKEQIEIEESDAYGYYLDNPDRYMPSGDDGAADEEAEDEEGQQSESEQQDPDEPLPYREVRERVYEDLTEERARNQQDEIIRWVAGTLSQEERRLPVDDEGYRELPEDYDPPSLEQLAEQVQERYGVLPDVVRLEDRWLGPEDVVELEGFGQAYLDASGREYAVQTYIFSARELEPDPEQGLLTLRLQTGIGSRPVQDDAGNRYVFRLLDADPPREPRELEEVRDEVIADLKRQRAYEMLLERQQEIRSQAIEEGLESLAEQYDTDVRELEPFRGRTGMGQMQPPSLPGIGRSATFVDNVFATAQQAQQEAGSIDEADADQKTTVVGLDERQSLAVAQVREYQPLNEQMYEMLRPRLPQQLQFADMMEMMTRDENPLALEAVKERVGFVEARPDDELEENGETEDGASPVAAN